MTKRLLQFIGLLLLLTIPVKVKGQAVTFTPTSVAFGSQATSQTSIPQTLTLTNTGGSTLVLLSSPVITGTNPSDFTLSAASTCINGANIAPGGNCTIIMTFTPSVTGSRTGTVSVTDNASGSPHSASLSGTGVASVNNQITINCTASNPCKAVGNLVFSIGSPITPASVIIAPTTGSVTINGTFPLVGVVMNDPNNLGVTWSVSGPNCTGSACGTISPTSTASGATTTYTAPPTSPGSIVITARAAANQSAFQANITVVTPTPPPAGPTGVSVFTPPCAVSGTTRTCSFTGYQGPTLILDIVSQATSSTVTGVQACISGSACANLTLRASQDQGGQNEVYQYSGINIGAGFNQVVISTSDTNPVNVAILDTANAGAFDTFAVKTGTATTNPTGPSLTTATANELVACSLGTSGVTSTVASPFVLALIGTTDGSAGAINPTASSISPSWTTTSGQYAALCAAYSVGTTPPAVTVVNNPLSSNVQSSLTQKFTATVGNDPANQGVTWTCTASSGSCGTFSPTSTASGVATTWTAPALVPPGALITQLQSPVPSMDVSGNPATIAIHSSTAGTTLCIADAWFPGGGTVAFTDSKGETWGSPIDSASQSGTSGAIDCLPNNVGGVGSITATVTGASPTTHEMHVIELSGTATTNVVDQFIHANIFTSPMDSGFATATTNANDYLFGFAFNAASSTFTAGNDGQGDNYTKLAQQTGIGSAIEGFNAVSATNTYKATMTPSAASGSVMFFVALKGTTGSGSGNANITITATSVADGTKAANSTVTLTAAPPPISVVVNPNSGTLTAGTGTISITPTVSNDTTGKGVNWTLSGLGSISLATSNSGTPTVYTPPANTSSAVNAVITAASISDPTKTAVANILINPPAQTGGGGTTTSCNPSCPAFIGAGGTAMGSGAETTGGRGGAVCLVTNLNDSGSGSFRGCATATGTRTVEFRVSGLITAFSRFQIFNPNMTIAGQTAPGGGIVLQEAPQCTAPNNTGGCSNANQCQTPGSGCGITFISTHDIVVRYLTYIGNAVTATGPSTGTVGFETTSGNDFNIVYDHISCRWWGNACVDIFTNGSAPGALARNITVQWGMFYEPNSAHPIIIKSDTTQNGLSSLGVNRDYHHNFAANYGHRWGLFNSASTRWVNNISYNGLIQDAQEDFAFLSWGALQADLIGNKYKDGPQTVSQAHMFLFQSAQCLTPDQANNCPGNSTVPGDNEGPPSIYMVNNVTHTCSATVTFSCTLRTQTAATSGVNDATQKSMTFQGWEGSESPKSGIPIAPVPSGWYRSTPLASPVFPIVVDPEPNLDAVMLATVGNSQHLDCQGNFVSNRDSQDARVIAQYQNNGPGGAYNTDGSDSNYNGPANNPSIPAGTACPMTIATGIYDGWITKFGLPTNNSNLFNLPDSRSGLTYGEDFLDGVVPSVP